MKTVMWNCLSVAEQRAALERPAQRNAAEVATQAREIIAEVRRGGDGALAALTENSMRCASSNCGSSPPSFAPPMRL